LLDAAREEHVPVDAEQILAVEPGFPNLAQRADRLGLSRDGHAGNLTTGVLGPVVRVADLPEPGPGFPVAEGSLEAGVEERARVEPERRGRLVVAGAGGVEHR